MNTPLTTWRWATKAAPPPAEGEEGAAPPKSKYAGNTPEARRERARHAALVRYGKENPMQARLAKIRAARKAKAKKGGKGKAAPKPAKEEGKTAQKGDTDAARVALGDAKDRQAGATAKEKAAADAQAEKEKAAAEKPKKGGGGGKGKKDEKEKAATAEDKAQQAALARKVMRNRTAEDVGLKPGDADALRAAADGEGGTPPPALVKLGLIGADGLTTDQGRRALAALERGDKAGYRAALQDVKAKKDRDGERAKVKATLDATRAERERERAAGEASRKKERDAAEAQELDDLADDYRAKRKGLSVKDQRRLVRAGRATYGKDGRFALNATKAWGWRWADEWDGIKHGTHNQASHGRRRGGGGGGGRKGGGKRKARTFANRKQRNADGGLNKRERDRLQAELRYRTDPDRPQSSYDKQRAAEIRATLAGKALLTWRWAAKETR